MSRLTQILRGKNIQPLTEKEAAVKYAIDNAGGGSGSGLPAVTPSDNGDVLKVVEGNWAKSENVIYPHTITGTASESGFTLSITAETLFGVLTSGKKVCISAALSEAMSTVLFPAVLASSVINGDAVSYSFRLIMEDGAAYFAEDLAGTDTVALALVTD